MNAGVRVNVWSLVEKQVLVRRIIIMFVAAL
jgi:hypothetical protein